MDIDIDVDVDLVLREACQGAMSNEGVQPGVRIVRMTHVMSPGS